MSEQLLAALVVVASILVAVLVLFAPGAWDRFREERERVDAMAAVFGLRRRFLERNASLRTRVFDAIVARPLRWPEELDRRERAARRRR